MLGKGFFEVEPFNPDPYWDNTVINLVGAQKFDEDTVFPRGQYSVDVQAGGYYSGPATQYQAEISRAGGRIVKNIIVNEPFIIRAYCGSRTYTPASLLGVNPYSGIFKVNGFISAGVPPYVTHVFGNAGSASVGPTGSPSWASSGNCLGDGVYGSTGDVRTASAAGTCLHFLPINGIFGTNYLFAFHTTGGAYAGSGSAYGGAASGAGAKFSGTSRTSADGGSTPYGQGGAGKSDSYPGNNGSGVGAGHGDGTGAAAWFDGIEWRDSNRKGVATEDGHIIIKYLGTLR